LADDGIYLSNGKLLINATGIKTGVILSKNNTTTTMKIDLDKGTIFSKNFELHAWDNTNNTGGIIVRSAPDDGLVYFIVGNG
jgi:hypothetical protein